MAAGLIVTPENTFENKEAIINMVSIQEALKSIESSSVIQGGLKINSGGEIIMAAAGYINLIASKINSAGSANITAGKLFDGTNEDAE